MTTSEKLSVVTPADWISGPEQGQWTYEDYAAILEDGQFEVVDGVLYMSPALTWSHQSIILEIATHLRTFLQAAGLGRVGVAPLDVELSYGNVVQPDVLVLLNEHLDRITTSRIIGAPDLVVEVASPSTARHDLHEKQDAYARAGVTEYWIVNPDANMVELLVLKDNVYRSSGLFAGEAILPSVIVPDFPVPVGQFFATI